MSGGIRVDLRASSARNSNFTMAHISAMPVSPFSLFFPPLSSIAFLLIGSHSRLAHLST